MTIEQINECVKYIRSKTSFIPQVGIVLGTGLGSLADEVTVEASFNYADLPHFPVSTVETHQGKLIFGMLAGRQVVVMQGRFHYYEGYSMQQVTFPIRVMKLLGITELYISNVSGGLNHGYQTGDMVVIDDHINLQNENPLTGKNIDELGVRFPDMLEPYNHQLAAKALEIGKKLGFTIHQGVYVSVPGPNLETRAEYKYLHLIGADCVGMSTVPEVIVARHMGLKVLAISIITDLCYEPNIKKADIREIIRIGGETEPKLLAVFKQMLAI